MSCAPTKRRMDHVAQVVKQMELVRNWLTAHGE